MSRHFFARLYRSALVALALVLLPELVLAQGALSDRDALRYIASHPDLIQAFGADPAKGRRHYEEWGVKEGRKITFDPLTYTASHPDLIAGFGLDESRSVTHYIQWGFKEGRRLTFDGLRYIASHPDLITAFGTDAAQGVRHYIQWGAKEGRKVTFDPLTYTASYPDLIAAFGLDENKAVLHYIQWGAKEGRKATFDGLRYIASNPDLVAAFGSDTAQGVRHYIQWGHKESRQSAMSDLDALRYIASFPDLIRAFGTDALAGIRHYVAWGYNEGRRIVFDALAYIASYGDLIAAFGTDLAAGARHYITWGYNEGRKVVFDAAAYLYLNPDVRAVFGDSASGAAAHYINFGYREGRATVRTPRIDVGTLSVSFTDRARNTTSPPQDILLRNTGTAPLVLGDIVITGSDIDQFQRSHNCGIVPEGGACTIKVSFSPTSVGSKAATLVIAHNAGGGQRQVALRGSCEVCVPGQAFVRRTTANGLGANLANGVFVDGRNVYVATLGGLGVSRDGGATFSYRTTADGLGSNRIRAVYATGQNVYVATDKGLGISTDGGYSFVNRVFQYSISAPPYVVNDVSVAAIHVSDGVIYAATDFGISVSRDGGNAWFGITRSNGLPSIGSAPSSPVYVYSVTTSGGRIFAGTARGLAISTDGGASFVSRTQSNGLSSDTIFDVEVAGDEVFVGTSSGLSISSDGGASFVTRHTGNGLPSNIVNQVQVVGSTIYVATSAGLGISTDRGATFTTRANPNGLLSSSIYGGRGPSTGVFVSEGVVYVAGNGLNIWDGAPCHSVSKGALIARRSALRFSQPSLGIQGAPQALVFTNAGDTSLVVNSISIEGQDADQFSVLHSCASLRGGSRCSAEIRFRPSTAGDKEAVLVARDDAGGEAVKVALFGSNEPLPVPIINIEPSVVDFGLVERGTVARRSITLRNSGSSVASVLQLRFSGAAASMFGGSGGGIGVTSFPIPASCYALQVDESCAITIEFFPSDDGTKSAVLAVDAVLTAADEPPVVTTEVALRGISATVQLLSAPGEISFGNQSVNSTSKAEEVIVRNIGPVEARISTIGILPAQGSLQQFVVSGSDCPVGMSAGFGLVPGASCTIRVTYAPSSPGDHSASLYLLGNFAGSYTALTGRAF